MKEAANRGGPTARYRGEQKFIPPKRMPERLVCSEHPIAAYGIPSSLMASWEIERGPLAFNHRLKLFRDTDVELDDPLIGLTLAPVPAFDGE
jgi:hypothetical protein